MEPQESDTADDMFLAYTEVMYILVRISFDEIFSRFQVYKW